MYEPVRYSAVVVDSVYISSALGASDSCLPRGSSVGMLRENSLPAGKLQSVIQSYLFILICHAIPAALKAVLLYLCGMLIQVACPLS